MKRILFVLFVCVVSAREEISWAKVYVKCLPDPAIESILAKTTSLSYMYLGGLPPE